MARIRSIKPEFWTSEQIAECSPNTRLLFIGIWSFSDDAGIHPFGYGRLKMEVFPGDAFTRDDIASMVDELLQAGLLEEYTVEEQRYWRVTGWEHQRIDQPTYKYPGPDGEIPNSPKRRRGNEEQTPTVRRTPDERSPRERSGEDKDLSHSSSEIPPPPKRKRKAAVTSIPDDFGISERVAEWAKKNGHGDLPKHLEAFKLKVSAKAYQYANWDAAFMTAIREDWARLKMPRTVGGAIPFPRNDPPTNPLRDTSKDYSDVKSSSPETVHAVMSEAKNKLLKGGAT